MKDTERALRYVLRANAASCIGFGAIFALGAGSVSSFLASDAMLETFLRIIGGLLVLNGLHLVAASLRSALRAWEVRYFAAGDFAWVAGTIAILLSGAWISTSEGKAAAVLVAALVGTFGVLQARSLKDLG